MCATIDFSPPAAPFVASSHHVSGCFTAARGVPVTIAGRVVAPPDDWRCLLDRYLAGWIAADPAMIVAATAPDYRFDDPLVGQFCRQSMPAYFTHLAERFARAGAAAPADFTFGFRGPVDGPPRAGERDYFREAPRLGLSGVTTITISDRGVTAECVTYDLNLASDLLRWK